MGKLFFGSTLRFHTFFDVDNDPSEVVLELQSPPSEYSAIDALRRVQAMYAAQEKTLSIEILEPADGTQRAPPAVAPSVTPAYPVSAATELAEQAK